MATRICDVQPCDRMRQALSKFFKVEERYDPDKGMLVVRVQTRSGVTHDLNIKYCPFCGTRVVLGLVDGLLEEGKAHAYRLGS